MAARAVTDDRDVVNGVNRRKTGSTMTVFAIICAQYVVGVLTSGYDPVMTKLAVTSNTSVIKYRIQPGISAVAVIAHVTALDMPGMFSNRNNIVMTTLAFTSHRKMVYSGNIFPVAGLMTEFAIVGGSHVFGRRCAGLNSARVGVTAAALGWRTFKNALYMAGITFLSGMNDVEWKVGLIVIK